MDLWTAARAGNSHEVQRMLEAGADPNQRRGDQHILDIVPDRNDTVRCQLLEAGAWDPEFAERTVWAAGLRRPSTLKALLDQGADPNLNTYSGTPLSVAASLGDAESVALLLQAGADPDAGNLQKTPLLAAIMAGCVPAALELLERGANPNGTGQLKLLQPLAAAAARGQIDVVRALLKRGADLNFLNPAVDIPGAAAGEQVAAAMKGLKGLFGGGGVSTLEFDLSELEQPLERASALMAAAAAGHGAVLEMLLDAGADPQLRDSEGLTARDHAERKEQAAVLEVFRARGIVNQQAPDERLLAAAEAGNREAALAALQDGANVNARDGRRRFARFTPLLLAAEAGHADLVDFLLQRGADLNAHDGEGEKLSSFSASEAPEKLRERGQPLGRSAVHHAAVEGHVQVLRHLLGADLNRRDYQRRSPLSLALERGHLEAASLLLQGGARPEKDDLVAAVSSGSVEAVRLLCERVAPSREAVLEACRRLDRETLRILLDHRADVKKSLKRKGPIGCAVAAHHYATTENPDGAKTLTVETPKGSSRLVPAPERRILEVIELLLAAGADPQAEYEAETPLAHAAWSGHLEVARRLVQAGARATAAAIEKAELRKRSEMVEFLREHRGTEKARPAVSRKKEAQDRWGPDTPQPDLRSAAARDDYQQLLKSLAEHCQGEARERADAPGCHRIHVKTSLLKALRLEELQKEAGAAGALVLNAETPRGSDVAGEVLVYPTADPYQVMALQQTNGANSGIGTGFLIGWLRKVDEKYPLCYTVIGPDTVEARFTGATPEFKQFAKEVKAICSDVVEQGTGTVGRLAKEMERTSKLFLWWD